MSGNQLIVKNTIIQYLRLVVISIVGLISSRVLLGALGASDFGLYNVVGGVVFLIALINNIMITASYRFIAFELGKAQDGEANKVFNVSLIIHFIIAVLIIAAAETIGIYYIQRFLNVEASKVADAIFVFRVSIFSTVIGVVSIPFQGLITAKEHFGLLALIEIGRSILALLVVLLVDQYQGNRLVFYASMIMLISAFPPIMYVWYARKQFWNECKWRIQRDLKKYVELIKYSFWILFGAIAGALEVQGAAILVNLFFGTLINAGLGIANQVNNMVKLFSQSINQAAIPQLTKSFGSGEQSRTTDLVVYTSKYTFFLMLIPALPIMLQTDYILALWLREVPQYSAQFVQLLILNALIYTTNATVPPAVQANGNIRKFQMVLSLLSIFGLPLAYVFFVAGYPPYFMFIAYSIVGVMMFAALQYFIKNILGISFGFFFQHGYRQMLLVTISLIPLFFISKMIEVDLLVFVVFSAFSLLWLFASIYMIGLEKMEKSFVVGLLRNFKK